MSERAAEPWCPECEWDLDRYEPDRRAAEFGLRWLDRRSHRLAYRLTTRQYAVLAGRPIDRPGWSVAKVVLLAAGVLLLAGDVALFALGCYLTLAGFPSLRVVPGIFLLLLAYVLRPRFGRLDPLVDTVDRTTAPTLFRLIDDVADAVGAPTPHVVAVDEHFGAYATGVGVRQRPMLCLGLALWGTLPPQQRVALLGHELGHFVNGDIRRGPLAHMAMTTLGTVARALRPAYQRTRAYGLIALMANALAAIVLGTLRFLVLGAHVLLVGVGMRDSQRAEYLADELAARAGGAAAAAGLADTLIAADSIVMVVKREARNGADVSGWRAAADQVRSDVAPRLARLRQLSVRDDTSLFASHPPSGLRARMAESRPATAAAVVLSESDSARIDLELARVYQTVGRTLAAT